MVVVGTCLFWVLLGRIEIAAAQSRSPLYPDIIPGTDLPVFTEPGFRQPEDCQPRCRLAGKLQFNERMTHTGRRIVKEFKGQDGELIQEPYLEVEIQLANGLARGWVVADLTSFERPESVSLAETGIAALPANSSPAHQLKNWFAKKCHAIRKRLSPNEVYTPQMSDVHSVSVKALEDAGRQQAPLLETSKLIGQLIGKCAIDDPQNLSPNQLKGPISYDDFALPLILGGTVPLQRNSRSEPVIDTPLGHLRKLDIPRLDAQKLIEIDALARTVFAEMSGCIPIGEQYAMAVARIIKNREAAVAANPKAAGEFIWEKESMHWPGKNLSTKAASSPVQFSGWNNHIIDFDRLEKERAARAEELINQGTPAARAEKQARSEIQPNAQTLAYYKFNKSGMLHTLCPPRRTDEIFYEGGKPSPALVAIWQNTVKIATEAVLYPEKFNQKTQELKDVLHYTSGRSSFYNFCPVSASVAGKKLESSRCLNLWADPKKAKHLCAPESPAKRVNAAEKTKAVQKNEKTPKARKPATNKKPLTKPASPSPKK